MPGLDDLAHLGAKALPDGHVPAGALDADSLKLEELADELGQLAPGLVDEGAEASKLAEGGAARPGGWRGFFDHVRDFFGGGGSKAAGAEDGGKVDSPLSSADLEEAFGRPGTRAEPARGPVEPEEALRQMLDEAPGKALKHAESSPHGRAGRHPAASTLLHHSRLGPRVEPGAFQITAPDGAPMATVRFRPAEAPGQLPRLLGIDSHLPGLEIEPGLVNAILHRQKASLSPELAGVHRALRQELLGWGDRPLEGLSRLHELERSGKKVNPRAMREQRLIAEEAVGAEGVEQALRLWDSQHARRAEAMSLTGQGKLDSATLRGGEGRVQAGVPVGTPGVPGAQAFTLLDGERPIAALFMTPGKAGPELIARDLEGGGLIAGGAGLHEMLGQWLQRSDWSEAERGLLQESREALGHRLEAQRRDPAAFLRETAEALARRERLSVDSAPAIRAAEEALHAQATLDPVTGLQRRSAFDRDFERFEALGRPFSLALGDLDNFSSINNVFGHEVGDRALREVCEVMKRYGEGYRHGMGEELMVVMPELSARAADGHTRSMLEAINQIVLRDAEGRPLVWPQAMRSRQGEVFAQAGDPVRLGASLGVVEWRAGVSKEALLQQADLGVYQAKQAGKNAVSLLDTPPGVAALPGPVPPVLREEIGKIHQAAEQGGALNAPNTRGRVGQALDTLEFEAKRDRLTGLLTRRIFDQDLADALGAPQAFTLGYADIDNFSKYNNEFGHAFGNQVLAEVARALDGQSYRLSGEELAMLLPPGTSASEVLEGVRQRVTELRFQDATGAVMRWPRTVIDERTGRVLFREGEELRVSVSIGAARARPGMRPEEWLAAADEEMMAVKQSTKNGVRVRPDPA